MKKIITVIILLFCFLFLLISKSSAQGNTRCELNSNGQCVQVVNCDPGCLPPNLNCQTKVRICNAVSPQSCNCDEPEELSCYWTGRWCIRQGSCGPGYEPPATNPCPGLDYNSCNSTSGGTCIPIAITPEEPSPQPDTGGGPIQTAIGPIDPGNIQSFIQSLLGIAFGVAGGIAFLLMLFGSFQIMTSSGNPEKMKAGSELITSALTGLLFIVFSVFLLKLIGVTILDIPGLKP